MRLETTRVSAVVPSLNPDEKFLAVVDALAGAGFHRIILVDDGSKPENKHYFSTAVQRHTQCVLLIHHKNLGKGRALKTALNYFLNHQDGDAGVVTVDGDNQHRIQDVLACAEKLMEYPDALVLGCRDFTAPGIPARSSFGNRATALCFKLLCGITVSDTQTGLRGIPVNFARDILDLAGERFEYETNMLLETKRRAVPIRAVTISTVYIEENASSHFNPLRDSVAIYGLIFKFLGSAIASTGIDFLLFILLNMLFAQLLPQYRLLIATVGARICSSVFNYALNKSYVFGGNAPVKVTIFKYYALCAVQTAASYGGVFFFSSFLPLPDAAAKAIVDVLLFLLSFQVQREWVFQRKKEAAAENSSSGKEECGVADK